MTLNATDGTETYKYRVETVELTKAPEGMPDDVWHSYTIVRGKSVIEGMKPGTRDEVMQHAETVADGLNERFIKGGSTYASRSRK